MTRNGTPLPKGTPQRAATAWLKCFLWTAVLSTCSKSCHFLHSMAQLTSQCTNTIYRWQFKGAGPPSKIKGRQFQGYAHYRDAARGVGEVWAQCWAAGKGLFGEGARQLSKCTQPPTISISIVGETMIRLQYKATCRERLHSAGSCLLPEPGGERVVTGYSTYLAPFYLQAPWQV